MRYRRWLQDRRGKSRFLTRYVEPLVNSAIRRTRIGSVSTPLPAASPERAVPVLAAGFGSGGAYESWWARTEPGPGELQLQSAMARQFRLQPVISVLVPVYKVPLEVLCAMVDSVRNQTYHAWELCILHAFPEDTAARQYLSDLAAKDSRIKVQLAVENRGISQNSNAALKLVTGEYVALLDHDDTLAPSALYQIARLIIEKPDVDFIYSDKDLLTEDGTRRMNPLFKPQWSPDIMLSANYLTHLCVMRAEHVRASGGWKAETDGAQDWDIFLRVMQLSRSILHLPKVLYHWRAIKTSVAAGMAAKPYASAAQLRTINHHLARIGVSGEAVFNRAGALKVEWGAMAQLSASIVLVSAGPASRLESRARAIEKGTKHPSFEILAVGPGLTAGREGRIRWIPASPGEPLGALLNKAARLSNSACLVFLDDAVEPGRGPWLSELVGPLQQKDVAIVGAKLIDPFTMNIRHAGIVFNRDGKPDYIFAGEPEHVCAEFGGGYWYRNWSAISGACFAVRREVFDDVGGFAESPEYPRLDIDLCLQVRLKRDLRIFYNPFARFKQGRSALIESWPYEGAEEAGAAFIRSIFASGDPYFHPELESRGGKVLFSSPQRSIPPGTDYAADARALTAGFDFRDSDIRHSLKVCSVAARHEVRNITWVLPEFTHAFYGGIYTILRFADYFRRAHGVRSNFLVLGQCPEGVMRSRIAEPFPELGRDCGVIRLTGYGQIDSAPATDATIATLWTTAYAALRFSHTRRKFYFMQDYETLFYPAGSINALVEATYRFGFYGICNTRSLRDTYASLGGRSEYFDPSIDPSVFFPPAEPKPGKPYTIFCYARPGHARNCFEMLMAAMRKVKQTFGEDIRIVAAGAEWDPALYGLGGIVENLGLLGYRATGALYRTCDAASP